MKLQTLITELGELAETYPFTATRPDAHHVIYKFKTRDNVNYVVEFEKFPKDNKWDRYFTANGSFGEVNKGDAFKVIATITLATIDFIKTVRPDEIIISHRTSEKEVAKEKDDTNTRAKINRIYLTKNMPPDYYMASGEGLDLNRTFIKKR